MIARMMIHVQLSSKIWHKQLLFIIYVSSKRNGFGRSLIPYYAGKKKQVTAVTFATNEELEIRNEKLDLFKKKVPFIKAGRKLYIAHRGSLRDGTPQSGGGACETMKFNITYSLIF